MSLRNLLTTVILLLASSSLQAQRARNYTEENPLVYEDAWDLWPYCFLNENGKPDGFNVELMKMIFKELNIPYTIKLKPQQEAFNDLRDGKSDLTIGISTGYHDEYGQYGRNTITLLTQSVATPSNKPTEIYNFKDLSKYKVIVSDNSFSHHLMQDYEWDDNAIPSKDIRSALLQLSADEDGQILWNTLSLEWLIRQNQIDNLTISPVNMPHGEYKFMSNNPKLLATLDSIYTVLSTDEKLLELQNKWFYPERQEKKIPAWLWYIVIAVGVVGLSIAIYSIIRRIKARNTKKENKRRNKRLAMIMEASKVRMWSYDVQKRQFTMHDEKKQTAFTDAVEEHAKYYPPEDFKRLLEAISKLEKTKQRKDEEEYVTLKVKGMDPKDADNELRDFEVTLSVLHRDKDGRPTVIVGIKKDITKQQAKIRESEERLLRYWSIFETPMMGILLFNKDGILTNINQKACDLFGCSHDEAIAKQVTYHELPGIKEELTMEQADGYQTVLESEGRQSYKIEMRTVWDDDHEPLGIFAFCRDITQLSQKNSQLQRIETELREKEEELKHYVANINYILEKGSIRLACYSPTLHTLSVFHHIDEIQLSLTQARCMTFVDNRYQRKAMHMLSDMDACTKKVIETDIKTTIRGKGRLTLHLLIKLWPITDKDGKVTEYFGLCKDISELKMNENLMQLERIKAQEIEKTQDKFLNNMLQEIRIPLNIVVQLAEKLQPEPSDEDERNSEIIQNNVQQLLHHINNILYISRLEAHMVEINKQPTDFAAIFKKKCTEGWALFRRDNVRYITEDPYEKLVIDIDAGNLSVVIERLTSMSARSTDSGTIYARYDYIGQKLLISFDDTGEGIEEDLDLAICKELITQMGGTLDINTEKGFGTTIWITLPCEATEVKRRKSL